MENQELLQAIRSLIQEEVKPIREEIKSLKEGQDQTNKRLDSMDSRLDGIESDMASERQQIELSQIVHGLRHNSEEVNAQLHSLGHNLNVLTGEVSTIKEKFTNFEEQTHRMADDVSFLVRKAAEHDTDIRRLKKA